MICSSCNEKVPYPKNSSYDDLWYAYKPGDKTVDIYCPSAKCLPSTILMTEKVSARRYKLTHTMYKGWRIQDVNDALFLGRLLESTDDPLLKECIRSIE